MYHILIVDDEERIREMIRKYANYGGRCGVESEEGKGSTFWFSLPMV